MNRIYVLRKKSTDSIEKSAADQGRFDFNLTTPSAVFYDAKIELRGQHFVIFSISSLRLKNEE